jgi:elongator complex protein 4
LDLEGGVGDRRTTPSTNAMALDIGMQSHDHGHDAEKQRKASDTAALHINVEVEVGTEGNKAETSSVDTKVKKSKKTVAFQSDRPELYDF